MNNRTRRRFAYLALLGALVAALGVAGCGRKGPLDPPPSAAVAQPAQAAAVGSPIGVNPMPHSAQASPQVFDADGRPIAPPGPQKRLPLDWLID